MFSEYRVLRELTRCEKHLRIGSGDRENGTNDFVLGMAKGLAEAKRIVKTHAEANQADGRKWRDIGRQFERAHMLQVLQAASRSLNRADPKKARDILERFLSDKRIDGL